MARPFRVEPAFDTAHVASAGEVKLVIMRRPNPVFSDEYGIIRETLIHARRQAGLSQAQLAAALGKAKSHVAMIERGQRRVDSLEFYRIARCLGLRPETLFAGVAQRLDAMTEPSVAAIRVG